MQNKYFGDLHDFYKFHFLKQVSMDNSLGIHWCLVPDEDSKRDGEKSLTDKEQKINPELYKLLINCRKNKIRDVHKIEQYFKQNMSHTVKYFTELHEYYYNDLEYEEHAIECLREQDLIFFDPDNGIEVAGTTNKNKYKYISFRLIKKFWDMGKSLIIFQYERSPKQTDEKIEIMYKLLRQEPNIITVKKGSVKYICIINGSVEAEHYISLDVRAQLQYSKEYKVENWKGTGGIC
jgi:hypothetical protein